MTLEFGGKYTFLGNFWSDIHEIRHTFSLLLGISVTRSGDLLDFGQLFKAFGNN